MRRPHVRVVRAADVRYLGLVSAEGLDVVAVHAEELDERRFPPVLPAEEVDQVHFRGSRGSDDLGVPAECWLARAPPPQEVVGALHDALQGGDATSEPCPNTACKLQALSGHVKHCEKNLAVPRGGLSS